jgi:hypothetical protein
MAAWIAAASSGARRSPGTPPAPDQNVRIHLFEGRLWNINFERAVVLNPAFLHITILEPLAIDNPRVIPQQSVSIVSNIDDIEAYIGLRELAGGKSYLSAIVFRQVNVER